MADSLTLPKALRMVWGWAGAVPARRSVIFARSKVKSTVVLKCGDKVVAQFGGINNNPLFAAAEWIAGQHA